jgi:hypothetical protein
MNRIEVHLWVAAILQWLVASSNVQNIYIMTTVAMFGIVSIVFTPELAGGSALGRFLSDFLAIFWGGRIIIQLFFYDQEVKRSRPIANLVFLAIFIYLCGVFAVACLRHNR